jgi:hypothetical protein
MAHAAPIPETCFDASRHNICVPVVIAEDLPRGLGWRPYWSPKEEIICVDEETADYHLDCSEKDAVPTRIPPGRCVQPPPGVTGPACETLEERRANFLRNLKERPKK